MSNFTLARILQTLSVFICFVDLEKAFDCVPHGVLWEVHQEYGVYNLLFQALHFLCDWSMNFVDIVGLLQGFPLSSILLRIFTDKICRRNQGQEGSPFDWFEIESLLLQIIWSC